jgi:hypothetical protein
MAALTLTRKPAAAGPTAAPAPFDLLAPYDRPRVALYLDRAEAEALLRLCAASPADAGGLEDDLFSRLGEVIRELWRAEPAA